MKKKHAPYALPHLICTHTTLFGPGGLQKTLTIRQTAGRTVFVKERGREIGMYIKPHKTHFSVN